MSYDEKCYALAKHFVDDSYIAEGSRKKLTDELAQEIQDCIEGNLNTFESLYPGVSTEVK